ncbi:amidohydrolase [Litorimonas cladophorae]|uniref:Amidohydrolase n=1 Tax=Litorimonas cladophorae TaxID=1220491 RepID=A0A918KEY4_9PROT|nr:amidohydrolase [Litorimonas cladophorae]GGX58753.1 amidohydrolase [Litorimonas cladophorae]
MDSYKIALMSLVSAAALMSCQGGESNADQSSSNNFARAWCISGGNIYTANDENPTVEAVAIRKGIITYAGPDSGDWCADAAGTNSKTIDLESATAMPGLTDAHGHLLGIGLREMTLNLEGTTSVTDLQSRLKQVVSETPTGQTIYGRGWIETHWPEARFPTREDLDAITTEHPVILERADGHASVVNTLALELAGITDATENPFGGAINREADGVATGMLIDNAASLIAPLMPELTAERKREAYIKGAELYASRGWANIHSMSVDPADIPLLNSLARSGKLKIRVYNSIDLFPAKTSQTLASLNKMRDDHNPLVTTRAIKLYADGALGSRGAALLSPYSDDEKNSGLMLLKQEQAEAIFDAALRDGTQVNTHAIGDRANRMVLDWYEAAFERVPASQRKEKNPRWRIEHSQIIEPSDISRFAELGVIPSMQPSHAIGDLHFAPDRLGSNRLEGAYAWRALIDSGAKIAGGSDAPVEVGDPRIELYAATQRKDLKGFNNEDWNEAQKVTTDEALKMFSLWPAYAAFQENETGSIEVGKKADITIFDTDIMTATGPEILAAKPVLTMVDGRLAYDGR